MENPAECVKVSLPEASEESDDEFDDFTDFQNGSPPKINDKIPDLDNLNWVKDLFPCDYKYSSSVCSNTTLEDIFNSLNNTNNSNSLLKDISLQHMLQAIINSEEMNDLNLNSLNLSDSFKQSNTFRSLKQSLDFINDFICPWTKRYTCWCLLNALHKIGKQVNCYVKFNTLGHIKVGMPNILYNLNVDDLYRSFKPKEKFDDTIDTNQPKQLINTHLIVEGILKNLPDISFIDNS